MLRANVYDKLLIYPLVIDCGAPQVPTNGYVHLSSGTTHLNDYAVYSCATGYSLEGSQQRRCQENGQWSGNMPGCLGEDKVLIVLN